MYDRQPHIPNCEISRMRTRSVRSIIQQTFARLTSEQCVINREAWDTLPEDLKEIVRIACQSVNLDMQAEYNWGNAMAVDQLRQDPNVELREIPTEIFEALRELSQQAADELSARDEFSKRVKDSIDAFMVLSSENLKIGELTYLNKRLAGT